MRRELPVPVALSALAIVTAEWMRAPGWILAAGVVLAALLVALSTRSTARPAADAAERLISWGGVIVAAMLAAAVVLKTGALLRIDRHWPGSREAAVSAASRRLGGELDGAVQLARSLADRAALASRLPDAGAFDALGRLVAAGGPVHGVVLFDTAGHARAWAGVHRAVLSASGPDLSAITTPFYLWLVARRQTRAGTAAAAVLLARSDDVPRAGDALTDRFAEATGVGLRFLDPRVAPADSDVYDYVQPGGRDTLFAVQPVPPPQGVAFDRELGDSRQIAAFLVLAALVLAATLASRGGLPIAVLVAAASLSALARAPLRKTFGPGSVFWPDTYSHGLLGPFSASAGTLIVTAVVVFAAGSALWRRGRPRSRWAVAVALLATVASPYVLQTLARGISPPTSGVTIGLWLTWQVAIVLAASSLVLVAAALVRGPAVPAHAGAWPYVAGGLALLASAIGLWVWQPDGGWPDWYQYVWAPALLLAIRPMPFRGTLATIAVVAGSSGALLTWRATIEGRMALATADVESLGDQADPLAVMLLDRLIHEFPVDRAPRDPGELLVLWHRSELGAQGYPAALAVWGPDGSSETSLELARLEVPADVVQGVARQAREEALPIVRPVLAVPGLFGVAAIPLASGRVLTIVVGPHTQLIAPSTQARLVLGAAGEPQPPYDLLLAPAPAGAVPSAHASWRRDGWTLRGDRPIMLPGGPRHVHAQIDLRGPSALLQRGLLVLALDVAVLLLLWLLVETCAGRAPAALAAWWPSARRSLRLRLSVSLGLFFLLPALAFAIWTLGRFQEQFRSARELLLERTLRDATSVLVADSAATDTLSADSAIAEASQRVDAELFLTRGGALVATSAPVLADLGLADVLVPSGVYSQLAFGDEVSATAWQSAATAQTLVGYRLVARADFGPVIVAAPDVSGDRGLRRREEDLAIAVLVGVVAGGLFALVLSGLAARALARPLQRLRGAALAVATGQPPALAAADVPAELEPIRGALEQAAADVEAGQRAQRVLAWGEMARQVAHEIKNPLTPIRLGIQHLLKVSHEKPDEVGPALTPTAERILAEIDRLDAIARTFSRFALPDAASAPLATVDLATAVGDVVRLYRMGQGAPRWEEDVTPGARALARRDELTEVLVNLCENARDAGATTVTIAARTAKGRAIVEVRDDGRGIPPEVLPRIFEPRFSTTTSGSGLGLAIAKRLVESWGGTIGVESRTGRGTVIRLELKAEA
ncbi:MAG: ATP-binding protein [Gemmatimonadales bacterium]